MGLEELKKIAEDVRKYITLENPDCSNFCDLDGNKTKARKSIKQSKACKKTRNKGTSTCEADNQNVKPPCKFKKLKDDKLVLRMDCMHYPTNAYPYFVMKCKKARAPKNASISYDWPIRESQARNKTKLYIEKFEMRINENKPQFTRKDIERLHAILNPPGYEAHAPKFDFWDKVKKSGKYRLFTKTAISEGIAKTITDRIDKLNKTLYATNSAGKNDKALKINFHHLRPAWALGQDTPDNFWPSLSRHQKVRDKIELEKDTKANRRYNVISIHDWWNVKLQDAFNNFFVNGGEEYKKYLQQKCIPPQDQTDSNSKKKPPKKMKPRSGGKANKGTTQSYNYPDKNAVGTYGENRISIIKKYLSALKPPIKLVVSMKCKNACKNNKLF